MYTKLPFDSVLRSWTTIKRQKLCRTAFVCSQKIPDVQLHQAVVRKTFAELLTLHTAEERGTDSEIKKRIHAVAKVHINYNTGSVNSSRIQLFTAPARTRQGHRVHPEAVRADAGRPQPAPSDGEGRRPGHLLRRVHASCGEYEYITIPSISGIMKNSTHPDTLHLIYEYWTLSKVPILHFWYRAGRPFEQAIEHVLSLYRSAFCVSVTFIL